MQSVSCEVENIERMEIQSPISKYPSLKEASTVLVLGYQPSLNKALVDTFLLPDSSTWNTLSTSSKETYSKYGLNIHQLSLSFEGSGENRDHTNEDSQSQSDSKALELSINTISTPGLSSSEISTT